MIPNRKPLAKLWHNITAGVLTLIPSRCRTFPSLEGSLMPLFYSKDIYFLPIPNPSLAMAMTNLSSFHIIFQISKMLSKIIYGARVTEWWCCSVAKLSWNPMDCSTPGFSVLHHLLEFAQVHVHWIGDAIQPSHPLYFTFYCYYLFYWWDYKYEVWQSKNFTVCSSFLDIIIMCFILVIYCHLTISPQT